MTPPAPNRFQLEVAPGEFVVGDHLPGRAPCYLFLHGLGSVRSGEKSNNLLAFAQARDRGFARFDSRGHGESSSDIQHLLISDAVADARKVLRYVGRSVLVGSSMGGLVATYLARIEPELVEALAVIAPAYGFLNRLIARSSGRRPYVQLSDGRYFDLHPDFIADASKFDEFAIAEQLNVPVFLVHGECDDVVPVQSSRDFYARLRLPSKQFLLVPGGDHRLNTEAGMIFQRLDAFLAKQL